jgi:pfkB family carbohydrate kinase
LPNQIDHENDTVIANHMGTHIYVESSQEGSLMWIESLLDKARPLKVTIVGEVFEDIIEGDPAHSGLGGAWAVAAALSQFVKVRLVTQVATPEGLKHASFDIITQFDGHCARKKRVLSREGLVLDYRAIEAQLGRRKADFEMEGKSTQTDLLIGLDYGGWPDFEAVMTSNTHPQTSVIYNAQINLERRGLLMQQGLMAQSTVLVLNEHEDRSIREKLGLKVLRPHSLAPVHRCSAVVTTRGARGALWRDNTKTWRQPAVAVEEDRLAMGMGDMFMAFFGLAFASGNPPRQALALGAIAGAAKAQLRGMGETVGLSMLLALAGSTDAKPFSLRRRLG